MVPALFASSFRGFSSVYELENGNLVVKRLTISSGAGLKQTTETEIFFFDGKELKKIDQLSSIQIDDLLISSEGFDTLRNNKYSRNLKFALESMEGS